NGASANVCADLDGDGDLDIAGKNTIDDTISIFLNKGNCTFDTQALLTVGDQPTGVEIGDFDGDGALDFAVANSNDNTITIHINR
ncbi:MAG: VCBS repeat-containing protein, partial [Deltaproteobacteria bacterium]|nr:VCBS repeat-containing protein [Deltaproteobacteria bacterium]